MTLTPAEEWMAKNATVKCPYSAKMSERGCAIYQAYHAFVCVGCERYKRGGRRKFKVFHKYYEEASMAIEGVKDLFVKPAPKRLVTKVQASVTVEVKDRITAISDETDYSIEKVCEALIMEGLAAYDAAKK